ncbi:MAG: hypothetical protein MJZ45_05055 [Bacteroidales bacterium]|nr:hypothetical protein [Bacteroidales bacterium]
MNKNDKEIYIAPRIKSVAFNVESGYQVSPGGDVFMRGFLRDRNPYREFDMDEEGLFGGNGYGNGSNEGYFARELNVE